MTKKNSLKLHFRPMLLDDVPQVSTLDNEVFDDPWPENAFYYELNENINAICWVAETIDQNLNNLIIAFSIIWLILDEAHIGTLAVAPDYRDIGVGRKLLAKSLSDAFHVGARKAMLEVRVSNLTAQRLYLGFGFEVVGLRPNYYQDNKEDALLMTLENLNPENLEQIASA